jgi:hypothetical protein
VVRRTDGNLALERFELSQLELWLDEPRRSKAMAEAVQRILQELHYFEDFSIQTD